MTSPTGPPDGDATGDGDAPQQDPSELGEAIRTGRVPIVPGSLVELVMQSGISADEQPDTDEPGGARDPSPTARPRPTPSPPAAAPPTAPAATEVGEPLEDADLGDLGDDPLGVGPVHVGPSTGRTDVRTVTEGTQPPAAGDGDTPSGAVADAGPATAPGDVVPPPIAPTPVPLPEPETGPREATPHDEQADAAGAADGPDTVDDDAGQAPRSLFGGPRPRTDGPETDVLPGMMLGRVPGRYPSADPVTSTGRTTMPGRRRPEPGSGDTPPPPPRPTMSGPGGARPATADGGPPLSAPPPAHAPGPAVAGDGVTNGTAAFRPAGIRPVAGEPDDEDPASPTATTGVMPAVADDGWAHARDDRAAFDRAEPDRAGFGYEADTRSWSPGLSGAAPSDRGRVRDDAGRPAGSGGPSPTGMFASAPARADGPNSGPQPFRSLQDPGGTRVVPAVPGPGRPADNGPAGPPPGGPTGPRTTGPRGDRPTGPQPTGPQPVGPGTGRNPVAPAGPPPVPPQGPHGPGANGPGANGTAPATGSFPARPDAPRTEDPGPDAGGEPGARRAADVAATGGTAAAATAATAVPSTAPGTAPGEDSAGAQAAPAEAAGAAEDKPVKKTTPPREAIMSAKPRHGRGVSLGGLAIGLAAILLAALTIWAIIAPSTPDPQSANGAGAPIDSPAALALRPAGGPPAASRADPVVRATVPVAQRPQDVAVSPGGRFAYLAVQDAPRLVVMDATTDAVTAEIPLPGPPRFVEMSPDGSRAFVSMSDEGAAVNLLGVVDVVGNKLLSTMPVGPDPAGAVPSPDGRFVYLASRRDAKVDEIDPVAGVQTRSVPVSRDPYAVAPSTEGDQLFVANHGSGQLTVLDPNTLSVRGTFPVTGDAQAVAASPTAQQVAVAGPDTDRVAVLDPADGREIASVRVDGPPTAVAFSPDGRHLYVTAGDTLTLVDTGSWNEAGSVPVGPGPTSITVSPDGRTGWVTNAQGGSVSVLTLG